MKKCIILVVLLGATIPFGIFFNPLRARMHQALSESKFYQQLDKSKFAVAFFYEEDRETRKDKQEMRDVRALKSTVKNVSDRAYYKDNGVQFIEVNKLKNDLCAVAHDYDIQQTPAFLLFENQEVVTNKRRPIILQGCVSYQELQSFIDRNLSDSIDEFAQQQEEERRERRQERAMSSCLYGPYYYGSYCGWPYDYWQNGCWNYWGGCGYGGCGARIGVGASFYF